MNQWKLIMIKRWWVPHWLYGLFCPRLGTYQPFRWILHTKPDPFTNRRVNGVYE